MEEWHYETSGGRSGPVSRERIQQLLTSNTITGSTLVWRGGMEQWAAIGSIDGFEISPYASPLSGNASEIDWGGNIPSGPQVRPWVRHWARGFDGMLFSFIGGSALGMVSPELQRWDDLTLGMLMILIYNFVEPALLSVFGSTPSKALLRVRVRNRNGSKLTYHQALVRTLKIWFRAEAMGIPFINVFTYVACYKRLTRQHITSWDFEGEFVVSHQEIEWWRWLITFSQIPLFIAWVYYFAV